MRLGLGFGLENKDQKKIKSTTKPVIAILDITPKDPKLYYQQVSVSHKLVRTVNVNRVEPFSIFFPWSVRAGGNGMSGTAMAVLVFEGEKVALLGL